ncbi:MAG TPA: hypothetical protein VMZ53_15355 [Kofleriaceae bacterium]|nr:hypothetical protein [Kofleriaceae bacterium]
MPWWTVYDDNHFVLRFDHDGVDPRPIPGRPVGAIRTRDIELDNGVFEAMRCAWSGDSDRCGDRSIYAAGEQAHDAITEARAELRARTADAGADIVGDVRCFAERSVSAAEGSKLWCEGVAFAATSADAALDEVAREADPAAPIDHEPRVPEARFTVVADAGVGMQGGKPIVSSTLGIRYRPIEVGFYIVDLQRESIGPRDNGAVGVGLTVLGRKQLRERSGADAILGGSAVAAFQNGSTNPDFDGLYQAFGGLAYQSRFNLWHGQPWVQLRAGAATGTAVKNKALPLLELHLGLATPERR